MNLLVGGLLSSPAGFIGGKLFDLYRSYTIGFEFNMLIAGLGIVALAFARVPRPRSFCDVTRSA
jgi:hypothetical protein